MFQSVYTALYTVNTTIIFAIVLGDNKEFKK